MYPTEDVSKYILDDHLGSFHFNLQTIQELRSQSHLVTKLVINLFYNLVNNALSLEIIQITLNTQTRLAFSSIH